MMSTTNFKSNNLEVQEQPKLRQATAAPTNTTMKSSSSPPPPVKFLFALFIFAQIFRNRMIWIPYVTFLIGGWIITFTTSACLLLPHKQPMIDRIRYGLTMFNDLFHWCRTGHLEHKDALRIKVSQIVYFVLRFMTFQPFVAYLWLIDEILYSDYRAPTNKIVKPVFALTAPRSGSTSFHRTLTLDKRFVSPNLAEFLFPYICAFKMVDYLQENFPFVVHALQSAYDQWNDRSSVRIFHDFRLTEPEVDEIIVSEYHLVHLEAVFTCPVPDIFVKHCRFLEASDNERTKHLVDAVMRKVMYMRGGPDKRILLRSHRSSRFEDFHQMYPDATYVGIIRNPGDMVRSISSFTRALTQQRSFVDIFGDVHENKKANAAADRTTDLTTVSGGIIAAMSDLFGAEADVFGGNVEALKDRAHYVTFPSFKANPMKTIKDLYVEMNMEFTKQFEDSLRQSLEDHKSYKERYKYKNPTFDEMAVNEDKFYEIDNVKRYAGLLKKRDVKNSGSK